MRSTGRAGSGAIVVSSAFGCVLRRRGERFELAIVDLPAFAKREDEVAGALQSYGRLTGLALGVLAPGGRLRMASCSSRVSAPDFFAAAQAGGGPWLRSTAPATPSTTPSASPKAPTSSACLLSRRELASGLI